MSVGDRIEKRLIVLGLKRAEASKKAGLNATYIRDLVEGRVRNPRSEHLARLAEVLETTLEWLAEGRGPEDHTAGAIQAGEVMQVWERIAPEDREHALRALSGFAQEKKRKPKQQS